MKYKYAIILGDAEHAEIAEVYAFFDSEKEAEDAKAGLDSQDGAENW
jgi:hypothetical protein